MFSLPRRPTFIFWSLKPPNHQPKQANALVHEVQSMPSLGSQKGTVAEWWVKKNVLQSRLHQDLLTDEETERRRQSSMTHHASHTHDFWIFVQKNWKIHKLLLVVFTTRSLPSLPKCIYARATRCSWFTLGAKYMSLICLSPFTKDSRVLRYITKFISFWRAQACSNSKSFLQNKWKVLFSLAFRVCFRIICN